MFDVKQICVFDGKQVCVQLCLMMTYANKALCLLLQAKFCLMASKFVFDGEQIFVFDDKQVCV